MTSRATLRAALAALVLASASNVGAQLVTLPPNVILPNNEGLAIGALGGLEGNAFTARVADSTAGYLNPAGLAAAPKSSASVSAGTFRFVTIANDAIADSSGSSVSQVPAAVGFLIKRPFHSEALTLGISIARTAAWTQSSEAQSLVLGAQPSYTTFSADAEFDRTTVAIALGWSGGGAWRFGGGLLGDILNMRNVQAIAYRRLDGNSIRTAVASSRATGAQATLRLGLGAQADLSKEWRFGANLRTPGVRIFPSGVFAIDAVDQRGAASQQASFFDAEADFSYRVPWEAALGIAWVRPTFEIELDLKGQSGVSAYDGFASTKSILRINEPGTGSGPVIETSPFAGIPFEGRAILNVSLGGHLRLDDRGAWMLHAGLATDRSPVGDGDAFFNRTDLTSVTIGVSGTAFHISGSLGLTYQFGTTDEMTIPDLAGGALARTTFKISNFGILYALSYAF